MGTFYAGSRACACAYVRVTCSSMVSLRRALELIRFLFAR